MLRRLQSVIALVFVTLVSPLNAFAQEREWQLDAQGEDAYLVFGVPNTADIGISLWCKIGEKKFSVFAPVPPNVKAVDAPVALQVEDFKYALRPKFNSDQNNVTMEAELQPSEKILAAIATAERIALHIGDHKSVFPTEGANIFAFSKLCTTAPVNN
jgi:hypothetical protein